MPLLQISDLQLEQQQSEKLQDVVQQQRPPPAEAASSCLQPSEAAAGAASSSAAGSPAVDAEQLATLSELCGGGVSLDFMKHVLVQTCHGDFEVGSPIGRKRQHRI